MSGPGVEEAWVAELARSAVARAAPEELPLFGPTSEAFFDDPHALERRSGRDEMLGFGVESALVLLTPVALPVAREVVRFVADQLRTRLKEEGESAVQRALDRVFKRGGAAAAAGAPGAPPELTDEELERVRAIALEKARQLELAPEKAGLLADAIVGGLATG